MFFHSKKRIFLNFPVVLKGFSKFSALRADFAKILKNNNFFIKKNENLSFFWFYLIIFNNFFP